MSGKLSVCMIVRDEADVLPRCLASLEGVADEIIALDTGSTDGTQDVLRKAGATVIESTWQDDFGLARTEAMRHATGDWILFIDADEALDAKTKGNLRLLCLDIDSPISLEVPILSYLDEDEAGETTLSWMPRLFNQPAEHFFVGRIHEQLIGSRPVRLDENIVMLRHWGYQKSRIDAKGKEKRNEALLTTEADEGSSLRSALYLAAAASTPEEALIKAREAVDHILPTTPAGVTIVVAVLVLRALNDLRLFQDSSDEATALLERFPVLDSEAQYWLLVGDAQRGLDNDEAAENAYRKSCERVYENRMLQSYWSELVPAKAQMSLAAMRMKHGDVTEARQILERALKGPRLSSKAKARLQAALASTMAATQSADMAWQNAQSALATLPELRATIANSFIEHHEPVMAMRLMAPIYEPLVLRDRVTTMAASLLGDKRAVDLLDWLLSEYGEDGPTRVNQGLHWLSLNQPGEARRAIAKGLGQDPQSAIVELRLAFFEQTLGRVEEAEARLAGTVQAAADEGSDTWLAEALTQWGNLAFQTQQWDKAADLLSEALQLRPQDPYTHYALASSRFAQGDLTAARAGYERALLIDPTFAAAHQGLNAIINAQAQAAGNSVSP